MSAGRILITGASGYIARHLALALGQAGYDLRLQSRQPAPASLPAHAEWLHSATPAAAWVADCVALVNLAGRAHKRNLSPDETIAFRQANVDFTIQLAEVARATHLPRFIHVSSIAAQTAEELLRKGVCEEYLWAHLPYAISKLRGCQAALDILQDGATACAVLRPTTVYGPDSPGHFRSLIRALRWRLPLPFASLRNRRAYLALPNFIAALQAAITTPEPLRGTFALADAEQPTPPELLRAIASAIGAPPPVLLPCPPEILRGLFQFMGRAEIANSLCDTITVDYRPFAAASGWAGPVPQILCFQELLPRRAGGLPPPGSRV